MQNRQEFNRLIEKLPVSVQQYLQSHLLKDQLIEIVLDLGRRPQARFQTRAEYVSQKLISWQDLDYITKKLSKFSNENRAGIERTLHRISCMRNRQFLIYGLTCRVGRAVFGTISIIRDLLESNSSILILGRPGVGKTTIIREMARIIADESKKRVVIIDTANEIAGESDIPHSSIGGARRMQVAQPEHQHRIMIEAVENHMPEVIIIDEISTEQEVIAVRTIAEKGVQLIGTTHGNCLENVIKNPTLSELLGGIQYVTLSDDEAKRRGTQKSVLERRSYPTFKIIIEINSQTSWTIHEELTSVIDSFLRMNSVIAQTREYILPAKIRIQSKFIQSNYNSSNIYGNKNKLNQWLSTHTSHSPNFQNSQSFDLIIYTYSLPNNLIQEVFVKLRFKIKITNEISKANLILGSKKHIRQNFNLKRIASSQKIPLYTVNSVSFYQIKKMLRQYIRLNN